MSEPTPIRPGLAPQVDHDREMIDYFTTHMRQFRQEDGDEIEAITLTFIGKSRDGELMTYVHSWSPSCTKTRIETCSISAALLTYRATSVDAD